MIDREGFAHVRADGTPKEAYESRKRAKVYARRYGLSHYRCPVCDAWHLGHSTGWSADPRVMAYVGRRAVDEHRAAAEAWAAEHGLTDDSPTPVPR
jgi:hypothetical protein